MMSNIQLIKHLMVELDKQGVGFGQAFVQRELDHFLNTAYLGLIEQKLIKMYSAAQGKFIPMDAGDKAGIQTKYMDDLGFLNIMVADKIIDDSNVDQYLYPTEGENALYIEPEKDPLHAYHASVTASGFGSFNCIKIDQQNRKPFIWNSLNAAYVENPIYYMLRNEKISSNPAFIFLIDPYWLKPNIQKEIRIYGIKRPAMIDSINNPDHEIEVPWWNEIVIGAATYALENMESGRTEGHFQISNTTNP